MIFKGIDIKIVDSGLAKMAADAVVISSGGIAGGRQERLVPYVSSQEIPGVSVREIETALRRACAEAFVKAHLLRARSFALGAFGIPPNKFPGIAIAKIIAQEIYRYTHEERFRGRTIKEIRVIAPFAKEMALFQQGITGYLEHIATTLEAGPFVTVDIIIEAIGGIVLIERSNPPFGWAIPGGFLDYGETLEEAALREAKEETGLTVLDLRQMHTYSDPSRDPRFQTITTVFTGRAKGRPRAASDAARSGVFSVKAWRKLDLAFDHREILEEYLQQKK